LYHLKAIANRWPFVCFFLLAVASNAAGSLFNIAYNYCLIVQHYLSDPEQKAAWQRVSVGYNLVAYPACLGVVCFLLVPLSRCLRDLRAGRAVKPGRLEQCRRTLVNLPFYQVWINFLGWLPGAVVFPLGICVLGGWDNGLVIWRHFVVSFLVAALLTSVQTFFLLEAFLIKIVYPDFFRGARPAEVLGTWRVPLRARLLMYWTATAVVPLVALLAVALNFSPERAQHFEVLRQLSLGVAIVGVACSGLIAWLVGRSLVTWVDAHAQATEHVTMGHYDFAIADQRPDELGQLTDRFNDMAAGLGRARKLRETFGQFVGPHVRDEVLESYPGLGGELREITALFADIRGFTKRSAGESPERAVDLLNRFFSLAVAAVEVEGGGVAKFLGDGFLGLFGAPWPCPDHADRAVKAALDLLRRLRELNKELAVEGQTPLTIGIGIHTGPALLGCIGAAVAGPNGRQVLRREFTAIGETVNLGQRLEQLTKECGGPVLLSEQTRNRLTRDVPMSRLGPQRVPGYTGELVVYRLTVLHQDDLVSR
jgi:adenylate cyclase